MNTSVELEHVVTECDDLKNNALDGDQADGILRSLEEEASNNLIIQMNKDKIKIGNLEKELAQIKNLNKVLSEENRILKLENSNLNNKHKKVSVLKNVSNRENSENENSN